MTIFLTTLKRLFKRKLNLIMIFIVPILLVSISMLNAEKPVYTAVVDLDQTPLTEDLKEHLKNKITLVEMENEEDILTGMKKLKVESGFVIEKGFTAKILGNENTQVNFYKIQESDVSNAVIGNINTFMVAAKGIAEAANKNEAAFYKAMEQYKDGNIRSDHQLTDPEATDSRKSQSALGFVAMAMLFLSGFAPLIILEDKQNKTFFRIFYSPTTMKHYMLQSVLSFVILAVIQVVIIFCLLLFMFGLDLGPNLLHMFILFFSFAIVCVSLGVAISSLSKDARQAGIIASFIVTPVSMLGGCFWPRDLMPEVMQKIANFVPTTWILKGSEKILYGETLLGVGTEILVLLMFGLVFFLLGTWRKADVAR